MGKGILLRLRLTAAGSEAMAVGMVEVADAESGVSGESWDRMLAGLDAPRWAIGSMRTLRQLPAPREREEGASLCCERGRSPACGCGCRRGF